MPRENFPRKVPFERKDTPRMSCPAVYPCNIMTLVSSAGLGEGVDDQEDAPLSAARSAEGRDRAGTRQGVPAAGCPAGLMIFSGDMQLTLLSHCAGLGAGFHHQKDAPLPPPGGAEGHDGIGTRQGAAAAGCPAGLGRVHAGICGPLSALPGSRAGAGSPGRPPVTCLPR